MDDGKLDNVILSATMYPNRLILRIWCLGICLVDDSGLD